MIRVRQVKIGIDHDEEIVWKQKIAQKLCISPKEILDFKINKRSIDARKKEKLFYVYEFDVSVIKESEILKRHKDSDIIKVPNETYVFPNMGEKKLQNRPIVVGSGPAGLFAAYFLAENGYSPLLLERGEEIRERVKTVQKFWETGILNKESNVQFGAGGAGTFSDGKLGTLVKDKCFRGKKVFEIFVKHGAPAEILYENHPHIGTDILRIVIQNMIDYIVDRGGEIRYQSCLTDITVLNARISEVEINHQEKIACDVLVLAPGHSARDTFQMLYQKGLSMKAKPFAVGVRIQHPQKMINQSQYGIENHAKLPPANYKLTYKATNQRGVYSFCMCPGGYVVNASSEEGRLAINGMSNYTRESENANSAIVVTVSPSDFGFHPLDGITFQQKLEEKAYQMGDGAIPVQLWKDFKAGQNSHSFEEVSPVFKGNYHFTNLHEILPSYICDSIQEAIPMFDKKIHGYAREDAILAAVESRTSSPVRIERDDLFLSNIKGVYPCGEGAGYAGGITTSAMDGIKVAEAIASLYQSRNL